MTTRQGTAQQRAVSHLLSSISGESEWLQACASHCNISGDRKAVSHPYVDSASAPVAQAERRHLPIRKAAAKGLLRGEVVGPEEGIVEVSLILQVTGVPITPCPVGMIWKGEFILAGLQRAVLPRQCGLLLHHCALSTTSTVNVITPDCTRACECAYDCIGVLTGHRHSQL